MRQEKKCKQSKLKQKVYENATELTSVAHPLQGSVANVPVETLLEKTNLSLLSV